MMLFGMLGSHYPSERSAAALATHRLVLAAGVTWRQVIEPRPVDRLLAELGMWCGTVAACPERPRSLCHLEAAFLSGLPGFRRLSVKQRAITAGVRGPRASPRAKAAMGRDGISVNDAKRKRRYSTLIEFTSNDIRDKFFDCVSEAVRAATPEALP